MSNRVTAYRISDAQVAAYERDGAVHLPSVIDREWLNRLRAAIERLLDEEKKLGKPNYFKRLRLWERDPDFRDFCMTTGIPNIAAQLMQTDKVNLLYDQVFVKEPGANMPTPWHNDLPYWPVRGGEVITVWVAFDPVTLENGGMEFVRGSHKQSAWYRTYYTDDEGRINRWDEGSGEYVDMPDFDAERTKYQMISWDLQPGDAVAFHSLTVHGAGGNRRSDLRRRAYAIRLASRDVRYYAGLVNNVDITNPSLTTGDPLDSPQYPVVYRAPGTV